MSGTATPFFVSASMRTLVPSSALTSTSSRSGMPPRYASRCACHPAPSMACHTLALPQGKAVTNIEPTGAVNDFSLVAEKKAGVDLATGRGSGDTTESGVILVAGEQPRMMAFYVPQIGVAPYWCSFIDSLTEELEESESAGRTLWEASAFDAARAASVTRSWHVASLGRHLRGLQIRNAG